LPEFVNRLRRRGAQLLDQARVRVGRLRGKERLDVPWDGTPRFALLCVNFHTTDYLRLMLLSLCRQAHLDLLRQVIIVDNGSAPGDAGFFEALETSDSRITVVRNRKHRSHAGGMRRGLAVLDRLDREQPEAMRANLLLFCDPDVLFLRRDVLQAVAACFKDSTVSHAGEMRTHLRPLPEAQASFLAVRRDWAAKPSVSPWVNHGSPAWWLQRDLQRQGGKGRHFPANAEGYILHRGRSAVAAAKTAEPGHPYATAANASPHFMGIPGGAQVWKDQSATYADWLAPGRETAAARVITDALAADR
jgi:hypothetical protein